MKKFRQHLEIAIITRNGWLYTDKHQFCQLLSQQSKWITMNSRTYKMRQKIRAQKTVCNSKIIRLSSFHLSTLLNSSLMSTSVISGTRRLVSSAYLKRRLVFEVTFHNNTECEVEARTLNNICFVDIVVSCDLLCCCAANCFFFLLWFS